jgi:hypothetical protein
MVTGCFRKHFCFSNSGFQKLLLRGLFKIFQK